MTSSDEHVASRAFSDAVRQLVLLHYQAVHGPLSAERLAEFHRQSVAMLTVPFFLDAYTVHALFLAEGANEDLDRELRRVGQDYEQGPISPELIPCGLPDSHWWWHYPAQFK
jgi:hypothetical protein